MNRLTFYSTAIRNLGLAASIRYEVQKRKSSNRPLKLTSKRLQHPIYARSGSSDFEVFAQIHLLDEYRCLANIATPGLVLDLGANVGYSSAYFLSNYPGCTVIAVEPDPSNFQQLRKNLKAYGDRVRPLEAAIWPYAQTLALDAGDRKPGHEWGIKVKPAQPGEFGTVKAVTIPDLLATSGYDRISLLKIDIEGAETEIFLADTQWLRCVDNLVIELHGQKAEDAFFAKIDRNKFEVSTCDELTVCLTKTK